MEEEKEEETTKETKERGTKPTDVLQIIRRRKTKYT